VAFHARRIPRKQSDWNGFMCDSRYLTSSHSLSNPKAYSSNRQSPSDHYLIPQFQNPVFSTFPSLPKAIFELLMVHQSLLHLPRCRQLKSKITKKEKYDIVKKRHFLSFFSKLSNLISISTFSHFLGRTQINN
jgi:hypothetical protein